MIQKLFENINPIMIVVFITYIIGLFALNLKKTNHKFLFIILSIGFLTELITIVLSVFDYLQYLALLYSISVFCFLTTWIILILKIQLKLKSRMWIVLLFLLFSIANFCFIQGSERFNHYTFVFGSLIYLVLFFEITIYNFRNENINFLLSNGYLLISVPIPLLIGLSFMFAFVSIEITTTIVVMKTDLFHFVNYYINLIYYIVLNIFIYKETKIKND